MTFFSNEYLIFTEEQWFFCQNCLKMLFCPEEYSFLGYTERFFREDSCVSRKEQEFFQKELKAINFFLKQFLILGKELGFFSRE